METLEFTLITIGTLSLLSAGALKLYAVGYERGFNVAKRCGACGFVLDFKEPPILKTLQKV